MQIAVSGKNMDMGSAFHEHAETVLRAAVDKYFPAAVSGTITLEKGPAGFEVKLHVALTKRMDMEASGKAGDAHLALDAAAEHIEKRLRRYKRRLKNHRADYDESERINATVKVLSPVEEAASDEAPAVETVAEGAPAILAEMDYAVHLMSLEEAVMQFELSGQYALMFRNRSHMGLNMLYRRTDGSIGWVDPRGSR